LRNALGFRVGMIVELSQSQASDHRATILSTSSPASFQVSKFFLAQSI
jgi:hypothetical protein